jgi:hypothetical protein
MRGVWRSSRRSGKELDGFDNRAQREESTRELLAGKLDEVLSLKSRHDRG